MPPSPGSSLRARALSLAGLSLLIATGSATVPKPARGALPPKLPIPASARVHGTTIRPATPAGTTTPPVTTTPAPSTPATAGGATSGATPSTSTAPATPAGATTPSTSASSANTPAATSAHRAARSTTGTSKAAIAIGVAAILLILGCLAWGLARWFAYEPRWSVSLRHSLAEAGWRLSASWDEFSDWARIGR